MRVSRIFWKEVEGVSDFQSIGGVRRRTHSVVNLQLELVREKPTIDICTFNKGSHIPYRTLSASLYIARSYALHLNISKSTKLLQCD